MTEPQRHLFGRGFVNARARRALLAGAMVGAMAPGVLIPLAPRAAAQATATAAFTTLKVAPADALAYVNIPLAEDSAQWETARDLLARAGIEEQVGQARDEALQDLPLDAFLGGEAAFIVTENALSSLSSVDVASGEIGAAPAEQGWAIALDARAPDTAFAGIEAAIADQADEAGVAVEESDYQGVAITSAPASPDDASGMGMAAAKVDDLSLIAASPADLEPLIDAAQGTVPTLDTLDGFGTVRDALPDEFLLFGFANGDRDYAAAIPADGDFGALSGMAQSARRYSGFTIAADAPGFRMQTVAMNADGTPIPAGPADIATGIAAKAPGNALFLLDAFDLGRAGAPAPDAPSILETIGAAAIGASMGMGGGMGSDGSTPAAESTAAETVAAQYEGLAALLGFNLQTDLIQQLTGEYGLWISAAGDDPSGLGALFASGVGDAAAVSNALAQLNLLVAGASGDSGGGVTTRAVGDGEVSVIETGPGSPTVEYGVVGGEMLIGVGGAIDAHVEGAAAGSSLADGEQFQRVMATLPEQRNGALYVDLLQVMPLLQGLSESTDELIGGMNEQIVDADPSCADYATQEEARAAYDSFAEGTEMLDSDFDGEVCEDFFNPQPVEAPTDDSADAAAEAADAFATADLSGLEAFALAAYDEDGMRRSSSILFIAE